MRVKTFIAIIALLTLAASYGQAGEVHKERGTGPTSSGRQGGAKVYSAEPQQKGSFGFGYQEEYFESKSIPFSGRNNVHGGQIFLNYAPLNFFQLFLNRKTLLINNEDLFPLLQSHSFSKTETGGIVTLPFSNSYSLGVEGHYALFNGNGIEDINKASSWGAGILHSWKTAILKRKYPLRFNVNTRYFKDRSHQITEGSAFEALHLLGISQFDMLQYGLGMELETSSLSPFVEYTLDHTLDSHVPVFKNPRRLTGGFKITPTDTPWQIQIGSEMRLSSKDRFDGVALAPKLNFFAGISYQTPNGKKASVKEKGEEGKEEIETTSNDPIEEEAVIEPLNQEQMKQYPIYIIIDGAEKIEGTSDAEVKPVEKSEKAEEDKKVEKVKKVRKVKKVKKPLKEQTIQESDEPISEPELPQATKESAKEPRTSAPAEKFETGSPDPEVDALKEIFKSRGDSDKGYEEETPNKNFLLHFR